MTGPGMGYQLAEAEWARTLAFLDGDGGVSIYDRDINRKGQDAHDVRFEQRLAAVDAYLDEREGRGQ